MKKFLLLFVFLIFCSVSLTSYTLDEYDAEEYIKYERYTILAESYRDQHPTALRPAIIRIIYYPNNKPVPNGRVIYWAKYSGNSNILSLNNQKGEAISTLRYALTDFSKSKGFTGAPRFRVVRDELRIEKKESIILKDGMEVDLSGWARFEEEVEFHP